MFFDLVVIAALLAALVSYFWLRGPRQTWSSIAVGFAAVLILLHLVMDGYRWQMVPAYALAVALALLVGVRLLRQRSGSQQQRRGKLLPVAGTILGIGVLGLSMIAVVMFPVFDLPEPTGPYQVGVTRLHFVDNSRAETFMDDPDARRELMVQVWYPAEVERFIEPEPYLHESRTKTRRILSDFGLPSFLFDHIARIDSHAYFNVQVSGAEQAYPVLVFSHGYGGILDQNVVQMQEMASHGYIVVSIAHPYEAAAVVYPDDRVVAQDTDYAASMTDETMPLFEEWEATADLEQKIEKAMHIFEVATIPAQSVRLWAEDISFVLDELERLNILEGGMLISGRMDMSRIGVFGHSFGGATAGQVCLDDPRAMACLNMDGAQWGDMVRQPATRPVMFMANEDAIGLNDGMYRSAQGPAYYLVIEGTGHLDFSDNALWTPLMRIMGMTGSIGGYRANEVMNAYTLAFFDQYVKGQESPLLNGPSPDYPEVSLESRGTEAALNIGYT